MVLMLVTEQSTDQSRCHQKASVCSDQEEYIGETIDLSLRPEWFAEVKTLMEVGPTRKGGGWITWVIVIKTPCRS